MHTHLHIFFSLYTMIPFPTNYTTTFLFFHSRWSIPTSIQSILTFHVYTSPHIPHFMSSLVVQSITEPKSIVSYICFLIFSLVTCASIQETLLLMRQYQTMYILLWTYLSYYFNKNYIFYWYSLLAMPPKDTIRMFLKFI